MFDQQLQSVNYQHPPWSTHYPELVNIFKDHPCIPAYNLVEDNEYCNTTETFIDATSQEIDQWMSTVHDNLEICRPQ